MFHITANYCGTINSIKLILIIFLTYFSFKRVSFLEVCNIFILYEATLMFFIKKFLGIRFIIINQWFSNFSAGGTLKI